MKYWYAVMLDNEDNDWGYGSYDLDEAKKMVSRYPDGYIAVIEEGNNPICVEEIRAQPAGTAMVYVAQSAAISGYGDCFDLLYTFDLTAAREALDDAFFHYTASERRGSKLYIEGWEIPVNAGEDAEDAIRRWWDDKCDLPNSDFYEDYASDR